MSRHFDPSHIRVLVVDDDASVRESLVRFLEDMDFSVFSAASAEEALDVAQTSPFDFGIIDIRLPNVSGDALIPLLHALHSEARFLIYTGSAGFALSEELKRVGVRSGQVFQKPVTDMTVFVQAMRQLWGAG